MRFHTAKPLAIHAPREAQSPRILPMLFHPTSHTRDQYKWAGVAVKVANDTTPRKRARVEIAVALASAIQTHGVLYSQRNTVCGLLASSVDVAFLAAVWDQGGQASPHAVLPVLVPTTFLNPPP